MNRCHFWNRKSIASASRRGGDHLNLSAVCQKNVLMFAVSSISFYHQECWGFRTRAPITGFQAKFWGHPCPAPFQEPHCWFSMWHSPTPHTGVALSPPDTHCAHVLLKPAGWVTRTAVLLGHRCDTDSCPKGCWSWAQLIWWRREIKQGAAASQKLHAAAVGWSSSTLWAGFHLLISYPSF